MLTVPSVVLPQVGWRNEWDELDAAARANLTGSSLQRFFEYKKELWKDGYAWQDGARDILAGFIWEEIECLVFS